MPRWWERALGAGTRPAGPDTPAAERADHRPDRRNSGRPRRRVECEGLVTALERRPTSGGAEALVAHLDHPGGVIELVWLGRRALAGLTPGTKLRARGLLTTVRGRSTIFNPDYDLIPGRTDEV